MKGGKVGILPTPDIITRPPGVIVAIPRSEKRKRSARRAGVSGAVEGLIPGALACQVLQILAKITGHPFPLPACPRFEVIEWLGVPGPPPDGLAKHFLIRTIGNGRCSGQKNDTHQQRGKTKCLLHCLLLCSLIFSRLSYHQENCNIRDLIKHEVRAFAYKNIKKSQKCQLLLRDSFKGSTPFHTDTFHPPHSIVFYLTGIQGPDLISVFTLS